MLQTDNEWKAGRGLDALIAEKVMGWSDVRQGHYRGSPESWYGRPPEIPGWESPQNKEKGISILPWYSRDIDAAWQVVERMRDLGWWYTLTDVCCSGQHQVEFRRTGERGVHHFQYVFADTVPVAICQAALMVTLSRSASTARPR